MKHILQDVLLHFATVWHNFNCFLSNIIMRDWLKTLLAGYAAYRWGGGCLGTIIVFVIVYWLLGHSGCH